jgi:hypothetical protein
MNVTITTDRNVFDKGLDTDIANSLWHILILNTPQETGNLRMNMKRINNSSKLIRFCMNTVEAPYGEYLDLGVGRNKKHVGFFSEKTPTDMAFEIIKFALTGELLSSTVPSVTLRLGKLRNYERKLMAQTSYNMNKRITAHERATLGIMNNQSINNANRTGKRGLSSSIKATRPNMSYNDLFATQDRFTINDRGTGVVIK